MRGPIGIFVGSGIIALGLAGLGVALGQMMTRANPHGDLISLGGLGVFVVVCLFLMSMAR